MHPVTATVLLLLIVGCTSLRLNTLTHTSTQLAYHPTPTYPYLPTWNITHPPMPGTLALGYNSTSSASFALDISFSASPLSFPAALFPPYDTAASCATLSACTAALRRWATDTAVHPGGPPLVSLVLRVTDAPYSAPQWDALDAAVASAWPVQDILRPVDALALASPSPASAAQSWDSVRDMALDGAWPHARQVRGKLMLFVVDEGVGYAGLGDDSRLGWPLQPLASAGSAPSVAAVYVDDPVTDAVAVQAAVDSGLLVRALVDVGYLGPHIYTEDGVTQMVFDVVDTSGNGLVSVAEVAVFAGAVGVPWSPLYNSLLQSVMSGCGGSTAGVSVTQMPCVEAAIAGYGITLTPDVNDININPAVPVAARDSALASGAHALATNFPFAANPVTGESYADYHVVLAAPYVCNARTASPACSIAAINAAWAGGCLVPNCDVCLGVDVCQSCTSGHGLRANGTCELCTPTTPFVSTTVPCAAVSPPPPPSPLPPPPAPPPPPPPPSPVSSSSGSGAASPPESPWLAGTGSQGSSTHSQPLGIVIFVGGALVALVFLVGVYGRSWYRGRASRTSQQDNEAHGVGLLKPMPPLADAAAVAIVPDAAPTGAAGAAAGAAAGVDDTLPVWAPDGAAHHVTSSVDASSSYDSSSYASSTSGSSSYSSA